MSQRRNNNAAAAAAGAGGWSLANLTDKLGLWDASAVTGKSDGDSVTAWPESFGLLSDALGSGTYRSGANGIGGQPAIQFNGTTNGFLTGCTATPGDFSVACVFTRGSVLAASEPIIYKDYINGFSLQGRSTSEVTAFVRNTFNFKPYSLPAYALLSRSGTTATFEVNMVSESYTVSSDALNNYNMRIGYDAFARFMEGLISEVIFWGNANNHADVRAYITAKYGIPTS